MDFMITIGSWGMDCPFSIVLECRLTYSLGTASAFGLLGICVLVFRDKRFVFHKPLEWLALFEAIRPYIVHVSRGMLYTVHEEYRIV